MATATPSTKRRRVENASRTLSKPFRSPLKTPLKLTTPNGIITETNTSTSTTPAPKDTTTKPSPSLKGNPCTPSLYHLTSLAPRSPSINRTISSTDPEISALLKSQRSLIRTIASLRTELETLQQAHKIETSGSDDELRGLIQKWRAASREAAEAVYTDVKERVNRMGGPAAWKEMQKRQNEWQNEGFDQQRAQVNVQDHGDANSDDTQTRDIYAEYDIDPPTEHEENLQNRSDDSDTNIFTMDMMLKSLNIDLSVIRFDKESQRWID